MRPAHGEKCGLDPCIALEFSFRSQVLKAEQPAAVLLPKGIGGPVAGERQNAGRTPVELH